MKLLKDPDYNPVLFEGKDAVKCVMCGSDVPKKLQTIGEQFDGNESNNKQARLLVDNGFDKNNKLCDECYWK